MPSLDDVMAKEAETGEDPVKLLLIGDSGLGKTGALVSLAMAGYRLGIVDFDNGADIIKGLLRPHPKDTPTILEKKAAARKNVYIKTLTDDFRAVGGKYQAISASAWTGAAELLADWKVDNLGPVSSWRASQKHVLVIDSLTFAGKAALRFILSMNGRLAAPKPYQSDYGDAQNLLETMLATIYSTGIKCHVIILSHVREVGKAYQIETTKSDGSKGVATVEEPDSRKGYAETGTGRALSPIIGRFFNNVLMVDMVGTGQSARREIITVPNGNIGLKNSAPGLVKARYSIETGLAEYFANMRGETSGPAASTSLALASATSANTR